MKKILTTVAVLAVFAMPAFAQSFCTCDGTGNVLTFTQNPITLSQNAKIAVSRNGLNSFAMVPRTNAASDSNSPGAIAGGSIGYNEMLRNF
ncbi:MAG: hypothetical protein WBG10_16280 [Pseudolabrys sp.]